MSIEVLDMPDITELPELPEDAAVLTRRQLIANEHQCGTIGQSVLSLMARCTLASVGDPRLRRKRDGIA